MGNSSNIEYSVVIPVYNNRQTLPLLVERLSTLFLTLDRPSEAVFVVDGSPDDSIEVLRPLLASSGMNSQLITHSRNFGSFAAIRTGMRYARGKHIGVMAADLQEPVTLMSDFFEVLAAGKGDIVVGRRTGRSDPGASRLMSSVFWWGYRKYVNKEIPPGGVDVFACTSEVAAELLKLDESNSSLVGLIYWVGYDRVEVPYERLARSEGKSGWSLRKKVKYLFDSIFSFTDLPIRMLMTVGIVGAASTFIAAAVVIISWALGHIDQVGYTPLMLVILFSTFMLLLGLGVVGSYVWRGYENSKRRPSAIARGAEKYGA